MSINVTNLLFWSDQQSLANIQNEFVNLSPKSINQFLEFNNSNQILFCLRSGH